MRLGKGDFEVRLGRFNLVDWEVGSSTSDCNSGGENLEVRLGRSTWKFNLEGGGSTSKVRLGRFDL